MDVQCQRVLQLPVALLVGLVAAGAVGGLVAGLCRLATGAIQSLVRRVGREPRPFVEVVLGETAQARIMVRSFQLDRQPTLANQRRR